MLFVSILCLLLAMACIATVILPPYRGDAIFASLIWLVLSYCCFVRYRQARRAKKRIRFSTKKRYFSKKRKKELGASLCIPCIHLHGLPISQGDGCWMYLSKSQIFFERMDITFPLPRNAVKDAFLTRQKKQHAYMIAFIYEDAGKQQSMSFGVDISYRRRLFSLASQCRKEIAS